MMTQATIPPASEGSSTRTPIFQTFGSPRHHADGELVALAFAGDGTLWSVEEPGVLRQWNAGTGQPLQQHFLSDVETLWILSDSGRLLASANDDLSLWEVASGQLLTTTAQPSWVTTLAFSGDLPIIATGHDDGMVRLWDAKEGKLLRELKAHQQPVSAIAFSKDGKRLASAGEDRAIHLWDVGTGKLTGSLLGHTDRIPALAWHPEGKILVSAGWDTTARVWDTNTTEPVILLNSHADQVHEVRFSPDGKILACADSANSIHIWHTSDWRTLHVLNEHLDEIRCLAFNPEGRQLASAGAEGLVHLWDPNRGQLLSGRNSPAHHSMSLASNRLASTCGGTGLRMWDTATAKQALKDEMNIDGILAVAFSPDGHWLAAGGADTRIHLWKAASGESHSCLIGQRGPVAALAVAPSSKLLASASASDGTVWLWDLEHQNPALLIVEAADGCTVEALAFHPGGRFLACGGIDWMATGGSDGAICIWDIIQPEKTTIFDRGTTCLAYHPSGRWLAATSLFEEINIWDMETKKIVTELGGHKEGVNCLAYSPDGRWLVSGSDDRTLRFWKADSLEPATVQELDTPIKALAFSPDGRHLFTGNGNTTCYQLDMKRLLES